MMSRRAARTDATQAEIIKALRKIDCARCGISFYSISPKAKFCSEKCKWRAKRKKGICVICKSETKGKNIKTCSPSCYASLFASFPRRSPVHLCAKCGKNFHAAPSQERKFCSYQCFLDSGGPCRAGAASKIMVKKYGAKKDANHHEITEALKKAGISVIDVSTMGGGFPDLIVCRRGKTILVEIKNPKTGYGKKGANKLQQVWAENWPAPVYIITSLDDVEAFANGIEIPTICAK